MTLGTHAVVGAAIATLIPTHPFLAFITGFGSHFILDSIPHWDYKILSLEKDKNNSLNLDMKLGKKFVIDLFRIGIDIVIGLIVAIFLFRNSFAFPYVLLLGSVGAMIPDFLQFVYFKTRREPFRSLQRFHLFIHANKDLNHNPILGIILQVLIIILFSALVKNISPIF